MEQKALGQNKVVGRLPLQAARRTRPFESGQTLVEFTLILPFLCLLLLGVAELGRAAFITIEVSNAATAGAEYGSQNTTTAGDVAGMTTAATNDADYSNISVSPAPYNGCACDTGTGISCFPMPASGSCSSISSSCTGQIVECVKVTTTATFSPLFGYPGLPKTYSAHGLAIQRVRR